MESSGPVGWTQAGPIVMVGANIATHKAWWGGPLAIDGNGRPMQRIAGSDCTAVRVLPLGLVPCVTTGFDTLAARGVVHDLGFKGEFSEFCRPAADARLRLSTLPLRIDSCAKTPQD